MKKTREEQTKTLVARALQTRSNRIQIISDNEVGKERTIVALCNGFPYQLEYHSGVLKSTSRKVV